MNIRKISTRMHILDRQCTASASTIAKLMIRRPPHAQDLPSTTHRELYKRLYATRGQRDPVVRFKAASTDGGVDHSARFWVRPIATRCMHTRGNVACSGFSVCTAPTIYESQRPVPAPTFCIHARGPSSALHSRARLRTRAQSCSIVPTHANQRLCSGCQPPPSSLKQSATQQQSRRVQVDNMFVPGVADAYCSHRGHDVSVLAVLTVRAAPLAVHRQPAMCAPHVSNVGFLRCEGVRVAPRAPRGLHVAHEVATSRACKRTVCRTARWCTASTPSASATWPSCAASSTRR